MQEAIEGALAAAGFGHYETSAFARPGQRARHNLNYWTFGDYLGIGAGAHGKISFRDRILRQVRERKPLGYLKAAAAGDAVFESRDVSAEELPFEFMLNALRLVEGFEARLFSERTGQPLAVIEPQLRAAEAQGLLERDLATIRPTVRGRRFLNDLLEKFLPDAASPPRRVISIASRDTPRS
jgi:coproporphyrinogen III oxidase-like Fe-S oxidoreductase